MTDLLPPPAGDVVPCVGYVGEIEDEDAELVYGVPGGQAGSSEEEKTFT